MTREEFAKFVRQFRREFVEMASDAEDSLAARETDPRIGTVSKVVQGIITHLHNLEVICTPPSVMEKRLATPDPFGCPPGVKPEAWDQMDLETRRKVLALRAIMQAAKGMEK